MLYVTKMTVVEIKPGHVIRLAEGPRGKRTLKTRTGVHEVDQDASLRAALPKKDFDRLVREGVIVERPDAVEADAPA